MDNGGQLKKIHICLVGTFFTVHKTWFFCLFGFFLFKWLLKPHSLKHILDISASHVIASYNSVLLLTPTVVHLLEPICIEGHH